MHLAFLKILDMSEKLSSDKQFCLQGSAPGALLANIRLT